MATPQQLLFHDYALLRFLFFFAIEAGSARRHHPVSLGLPSLVPLGLLPLATLESQNPNIIKSAARMKEAKLTIALH